MICIFPLAYQVDTLCSNNKNKVILFTHRGSTAGDMFAPVQYCLLSVDIICCIHLHPER